MMVTYNDGVIATAPGAIYGNVVDGDNYFIRRLSGDDWRSATDEQKLRALYEATATIDTLNFVGEKTDPDQILQFPRGGDTAIPDRVLYATYELADRLLGGLLIDYESDSVSQKRVKFGMSEVETEKRNIPEYKTAGVFSAVVWRYLGPFLQNNQELRLKRV